MPRIRRFGNRIAIYVYASPAEHPPPHFHVVGPDLEIAVEIATLRIMAGRYRPKDIVEALDWASSHADLLLQRWSELNERD